jgi:hypothetical protein
MIPFAAFPTLCKMACPSCMTGIASIIAIAALELDGDDIQKSVVMRTTLLTA